MSSRPSSVPYLTVPGGWPELPPPVLPLGERILSLRFQLDPLLPIEIWAR